MIINRRSLYEAEQRQAKLTRMLFVLRLLRFLCVALILVYCDVLKRNHGANAVIDFLVGMVFAMELLRVCGVPTKWFP